MAHGVVTHKHLQKYRTGFIKNQPWHARFPQAKRRLSADEKRSAVTRFSPARRRADQTSIAVHPRNPASFQSISLHPPREALRVRRFGFLETCFPRTLVVGAFLSLDLIQRWLCWGIASSAAVFA